MKKRAEQETNWIKNGKMRSESFVVENDKFDFCRRRVHQAKTDTDKSMRKACNASYKPAGPGPHTPFSSPVNQASGQLQPLIQAIP